MERDSSAQPLLSVVTICYNAEKTIGNTIQSVISQGFDDYEYIIIDGASTDGTLKILNQYADKNPKMKVFSEKDSGISDAFNKGIMKSKGILIGLLNADDSYCRGALTAIADKYNATEADIIYGDAVIVDEKNGIKTLKKAKPLSRLDYELPFIHQSCFVSKQAYQKYGLIQAIKFVWTMIA